ncbi:MAG: COX15/CtaA family protein [Acidobacteria bacterium]|nr:COX15/CtaA family protein [Acidobacteriota bacterium]MBI3656119.1 COX15/CtaA family protein [Acidobacteriota bacterium]
MIQSEPAGRQGVADPYGQGLYQPYLHRFAVLTAAASVILIAAGAAVTSTGSGDAVPDWPLAYGAVFPRMVGGVLIEHSHRLLAGLTSILIGVLGLWLWAKEARRWTKWIGGIACLAVLAQALLGGLRVLIISQESLQAAALRLSGLGHINPVRIGVAAAHAFLAQVVLCLTFTLATVTSRAWLGFAAVGKPRSFRAGRWLIAVMVLVVFAQLILGALMRHMGAGLVIPDFPLAFGHWVPPFVNLPLDARAPFPLTREDLLWQVLVHYSHRVVALFVMLLVVGLMIRGKRRRDSESISGRVIGLIAALTLTQVSLGAAIIWTKKAMPVTVAHVTIGALLLGACISLALWSWRAPGAPSEVRSSLPLGTMEVLPQ